MIDIPISPWVLEKYSHCNKFLTRNPKQMKSDKLDKLHDPVMHFHTFLGHRLNKLSNGVERLNKKVVGVVVVEDVLNTVEDVE